VAANIQGKWFKRDLSDVHLREATRHGDPLGAVESNKGLESITKKRALEWGKAARHGSTYVTGKSGVRAEFQDDEMSTFLTLSKGTDRVIVLKSDIESCGEPTFSPTKNIWRTSAKQTEC
jgi:hypothetical protein